MATSSGESAVRAKHGGAWRFGLRSFLAVTAGCAFVALTARFLHQFGLSVPGALFFTLPWSVGAFSAIAIARRLRQSTILFGVLGSTLGTAACYFLDVLRCGNLFPWPAVQILLLFAGFAICGILLAGIVSIITDGIAWRPGMSRDEER